MGSIRFHVMNVSCVFSSTLVVGRHLGSRNQNSHSGRVMTGSEIHIQSRGAQKKVQRMDW